MLVKQRGEALSFGSEESGKAQTRHRCNPTMIGRRSLRCVMDCQSSLGNLSPFILHIFWPIFWPQVRRNGSIPSVRLHSVMLHEVAPGFDQIDDVSQGISKHFI